MIMGNDIKEKIEKLQSLGLDEGRIVALINLGFEDFIDTISEDLEQASADDISKLLSDLEKVNTENMNPEEATNTIKESLQKIYGLSYEGKWLSFLSEYLDECLEEANSAKEFLTKVENNDPEALKQVIKAQNDPNFESIKKVVESTSSFDE